MYSTESTVLLIVQKHLNKLFSDDLDCNIADRI